MRRNNFENRSSQKIIIFTEDAKSARYYINDFIKSREYPSQRIVVVQPENHSPWGLWEAARTAIKDKFVLDAKRKKHTIVKDDIFWLAFDADQHSKLQETFLAAHDSKVNIGIAFSAICFEIWLMMHFHNKISAYPDFDTLRKNTAFRTYFPNYAKGDASVFQMAHATINGATGDMAVAKNNAIQLRKKSLAGNPDALTPCKLNPYCNFYLLFDSIDAFFSNKKLTEREKQINALQEDSFHI